MRDLAENWKNGLRQQKRRSGAGSAIGQDFRFAAGFNLYRMLSYFSVFLTQLSRKKLRQTGSNWSGRIEVDRAVSETVAIFLNFSKFSTADVMLKVRLETTAEERSPAD
jgi:hypothetical protein